MLKPRLIYKPRHQHRGRGQINGLQMKPVCYLPNCRFPAYVYQYTKTSSKSNMVLPATVRIADRVTFLDHDSTLASITPAPVIVQKAAAG
ncbi:unnamed protein product [Linum trigynum]|uniref:Uncharacterized protein n=1 Tax=Linum trigynum TaxID=586398 RepID=A0AAV2FIY1_9ROSI